MPPQDLEPVGRDLSDVLGPIAAEVVDRVVLSSARGARVLRVSIARGPAHGDEPACELRAAALHAPCSELTAGALAARGRVRTHTG